MVFSGWKLAGERPRTQDVQVGVMGAVGLGLACLVLLRTNKALALLPLASRHFAQYTAFGLCLGGAGMGAGYMANKWWEVVDSKLL